MRGPSRSMKFSLMAMSLSVALASTANAQDSGTGVDLHFGSPLDPAGTPHRQCSPDGMTWLPGPAARTPTGFLYGCAPATDWAPIGSSGNWLSTGSVGLGYLHLNGDENNAAWRRYTALDDGFVLTADFRLVRPDQGRYVDVRASRHSNDSQYYRAVFGTAGRYRAQAFIRTTPNVLSTNARSIWNGVGSSNLTLKDGLTINDSSVAEVSAVSAAQPFQTLQVIRDKQGFGIEYMFDPRWSASFKASHESRKGARPFGGTMFFNFPMFPFFDNGGIYEVPRPIDDSTINLNAGLNFVGNEWRMQFDYTGSFFRNGMSGFEYEVPYAITNVVGFPFTNQIERGQHSYEPENDYHNISGTFSRRIQWNGDFSIRASLGTSRQDDDLLAPTNCTGQFGLPAPFVTYDCGDWNTTDALSRRSADLAINTQRLDARLVLQPTRQLTWRSSAKFHREDYDGTYWAFNPLTGQYGYVAANGSQGNIVPGEAGIWDPGANSSVLTRVRNLPLDKETWEASSGVTWRAGRTNTLGATYTFTRTERTNREFATVEDNGLALSWSNRSTDWLTLRANYEFLDRSGENYNSNPYEFTYSEDLPGYTGPHRAHTIAQLRKYELAEREQNKLSVMATAVLPNDMTLSASVRGNWNDYGAEIGRQKQDSLGTSLQWEWQPAAGKVASAWYGYDESEMRFGNANDAAVPTADADLGGSTYPLDRRWWHQDEQENQYAGANWTQAVGKATFDAAWNWTYSRGINSYEYASPAALADPALAATAAGQFPAMIYRSNSLSLTLSFPINDRVGVKLFNTYEQARISDWHYLGFDQSLVYDHKVYTDGGPVDYGVNMFGAMLEVRL